MIFSCIFAWGLYQMNFLPLWVPTVLSLLTPVGLMFKAALHNREKQLGK